MIFTFFQKKKKPKTSSFHQDYGQKSPSGHVLYPDNICTT